MSTLKAALGHALVLLALAGATAAGAWRLDPEKKDPPPTETPAAPAKEPATKPAETKPAASKPSETKPADAKAAGDAYVLAYTMKGIDGKDVKLDTFKGKVVVMVNVASQCGLTRQYEGLQKLYLDKKEKGLVILGFPANNFGGQEPGSNEEIAKFCSSRFKVTFPMFAKISVKGEDCHPLYKQLAARAGGEPSWNFTKYLVDRTGKVVQRFDSRVKPDDEAFLKKIDELLNEKPQG